MDRDQAIDELLASLAMHELWRIKARIPTDAINLSIFQRRKTINEKFTDDDMRKCFETYVANAKEIAKGVDYLAGAPATKQIVDEIEAAAREAIEKLTKC